MTRVEQFDKLRPLLFTIARRIIAGMGEAEDAGQGSWLRSAPSTPRPAPHSDRPAAAQ